MPELAEFVAECGRLGTSEEAIETAEKVGFDTGLRVRHPFRDGVELPVYVANFVLMEYGTGAIFGSAGHDQRDLDFARKYGVDVIPVSCGRRRRACCPPMSSPPCRSRSRPGSTRIRIRPSTVWARCSTSTPPPILDTTLPTYHYQA